jgi:hypothetical protein
MFALREALPDLPRSSGPLPTQLPDVCAEEMRAAGFGDVSATIVRGSVRYPSAATYWDVMQRQGAPMAVLRAKLGEEAWQAATERVRGVLHAKYGAGEIELDAEAIFTTGVRK